MIVGILLFLVFIVDEINSQGCTPTSTAYLCTNAPSRTVGPTTTPSPAFQNTPTRCPLDPFSDLNMGQNADEIRIHADQTFPAPPSIEQFTSQFGKTSGGGAPSVPTSSGININAIYNHIYGGFCGQADCTFNNNFFGRPNCGCGPQQGNILPSTYASPTPVPSPTVPVPAPTYFGYKRSDNPTLSSNDAFYPTQIGYWMFSFDCMGNNVANQRFIEIYEANTGTFLKRSLKDFSGFGSLSVKYGRQYDTIGGISDGIYVSCQGCEVGPVGSSFYCSFAAYRSAP